MRKSGLHRFWLERGLYSPLEKETEKPSYYILKIKNPIETYDFIKTKQNKTEEMKATHPDLLILIFIMCLG